MAVVICGHSAVRGEPVLCSEAGSESALSLQMPSHAIHKHLALKLAFPWDNAKKGISPKATSCTTETDTHRFHILEHSLVFGKNVSID